MHPMGYVLYHLNVKFTNNIDSMQLMKQISTIKMEKSQKILILSILWNMFLIHLNLRTPQNTDRTLKNKLFYIFFNFLKKKDPVFVSLASEKWNSFKFLWVLKKIEIRNTRYWLRNKIQFTCHKLQKIPVKGVWLMKTLLRVSELSN